MFLDPRQPKSIREEIDSVVDYGIPAIYEDPGCDALSRSSVQDLTYQEPEHWERELDHLEREEDLSHFAEDGVVYP